MLTHAVRQRLSFWTLSIPNSHNFEDGFILAHVIKPNIKGVGEYCGKFTSLAHCATFLYTYIQRYIKKDAGDMLKKLRS